LWRRAVCARQIFIRWNQHRRRVEMWLFHLIKFFPALLPCLQADAPEAVWCHASAAKRSSSAAEAIFAFMCPAFALCLRSHPRSYQGRAELTLGPSFHPSLMQFVSTAGHRDPTMNRFPEDDQIKFSRRTLAGRAVAISDPSNSRGDEPLAGVRCRTMTFGSTRGVVAAARRETTMVCNESAKTR
jgi:hypothetical protein